MTHHTKGPWRVGEKNILPRWIMGRRNGRDVGVAEVLYDEDCEPTLEEQEANSHLIAAAPELLEAVKEVERVLGKQYFSDMAEGKVYESLRDAIAKAEGRE